MNPPHRNSPVSSQDKIKELAMAALRAAPTPGGAPKPAGFTPVAQPLTETPSDETLPTQASFEAPAPKETEGNEETAPAFKDHGDPELRAMIEEQEKRKEKALAKKRRILALTALAIIAGLGTSVALSPSLQSKLLSVTPMLKQAKDDVKMLGNMTSQYDESLEKISAQGKHIEDATRAMGVEPASVGEDEDLHMTAEMNELTGGEGNATGDRNANFRKKFGIVEKLAKDDKNKKAGE